MAAKRKFLNIDEINTLVKNIPDSENAMRDRCLIIMCFIHGLRVTELIQLQIQDVMLDSNMLNVSRLKNGLSVQHPLQIKEKEYLESWLAVRKFYKNAHSPWLFLSRRGAPLSRQRIYNIMKNYGHNAGLNIAVHPHMLRHSCGYSLANQGMDTRLIQDYLGHKNIRNTVIYTASNMARFLKVKF